jgi:hypothetical protein
MVPNGFPVVDLRDVRSYGIVGGGAPRGDGQHCRTRCPLLEEMPLVIGERSTAGGRSPGKALTRTRQVNIDQSTVR